MVVTELVDHMIIDNRLFAECKVLDMYKDFVVQGLVNWSWRILEDKNFPRGQLHCIIGCYFVVSSSASDFLERMVSKMTS